MDYHQTTGSPIANHIKSIVKITVSPNTPSPEPEQSDPPTDQTPLGGGGESFRECTAELTDVGAMGNCKNSYTTTSYHNLEDQGPHTSSTTKEFTSVCDPPTHPIEGSSRDLPICFDFGIQDYLCRRVEETEFDLSSDTDTSYLGASPPFGDICQSSIEAMPILLDTQLNLHDDQGSRSDIEELESRLSLNLKETNTSKYFGGKSVSKESLKSFHATTPSSLYNNDNNTNPTKTKIYQERRFPRPFRRNISLPAMFKSYLQQNTEFTNLRDKNNGHDKEGGGGGGMVRADTLTSRSSHHRLSRIESISNSSQINMTDEPHDESLTSSVNSIASNWNISGSIDSDVENEPFTSEVEKKSLIIRHLRQKNSLIRRDTTGNFAPADYKND